MGNTQHQRIRVGIILGALFLTAMFLAQGINHLVAHAFFGTKDEPVSSIPLSSSYSETKSSVKGVRLGMFGQSKDVSERATFVLQRNIFDSETGAIAFNQPTAPIVSEGDAVPIVPTEPPDPNQPPPACGNDWRLVAALVNHRHPDNSLASIHMGSEDAEVFRTGMELQGQRVVDIRPKWVVLQPTGGAYCALHMFDDAGSDSKSAPSSAVSLPPPVERPRIISPRSRKSSRFSEEELNANIKKVSGTKYSVNRSFVDKLLNDRAELMRMARVVPKEEDGRVVGAKLYGIRPGSVLQKIGLEQGDMLRTINGFDMTSPTGALEALAKLRTASRLNVSIVRNGQPTTLEYTIR